MLVATEIAIPASVIMHLRYLICTYSRLLSLLQLTCEICRGVGADEKVLCGTLSLYYL